MKSKKELRNEYKLMKLRVGVFQIIHRKENKMFLQTSTDLDSDFNSDIFKPNSGLHSNKSLQSDWDEYGSESFELEILDELKVKDTATTEEIRKDLEDLLEIHKAEMKLNGQALY